MGLPDDAQLISVDDHVIEHPRVWLDRLPAKYKDVAPRIETLPDGNDAWIYEGDVRGNFALNAVAGKHPREFGMDPRSYDDMRDGCHDIKSRLADMDIEGVHAQMCFPNMGGFAGSTFWQSKDKELGSACISAYNDFILDEWCAYDPGRQIPLVMIPFWDVAASVKEIERTAAKGAKSVTFLEAPHKLGLPSFHTDHWDPIFKAAEEADLPLSAHFGSGGVPLGTAPDGDMFIQIALFGMNSIMATVDLLMSPTFYKFPNLKFVLVRGWHGLDPLHPRAHGLLVGAPPLLVQHQRRAASLGAVQGPHLRLLRLRPGRYRRASQDRHRADPLRERLPALGRQLAAHPQDPCGADVRGSRGRGPSDG